MTPFTLFLGRLTQLVGSEAAAQLTREFAGQTLLFPITDHYGISQEALGAGYRASKAPAEYRDQVLALAKENDISLSAAIRLLRANRLTELHEASTRSRAHTPLTEAEAMEIGHRLLAAVRKCSAAPQSATLSPAESLGMDASYIAHPDRHTAHQQTPAAVQPGSAQVTHTHLASQPASPSVLLSSLEP